VWLYACGHTFLGTPATAEKDYGEYPELQTQDSNTFI
jgi:hypothetical protein